MAYKAAHPEVEWEGEQARTADPNVEELVRVGILEAKSSAVRAATQTFVEAVGATGGRVIVALELMPIVYVEADAAALEDLARRPDVVEVLAPASYDLAMDVAKPAIRADVVEGLGLDGSGVKLGIIEYARINWGHSGLPVTVPHTERRVSTNGSACEVGQGAGPTSGHMTWVAAIAASRQVGAGSFPGIANDVHVVEASANSSASLDPSDPRILKAAECAMLARATVLNLSLVQNDDAYYATSARFFDEMVDQNRVTVVAAAGNHGDGVNDPNTTFNDHCPDDPVGDLHKVRAPGSAWNVVAVGAYNEFGLGSGDDKLWWRVDGTGPAYCWQEPNAMASDGTTNDREKPELSAPGVRIQTSTGHHDAGTSASSPMTAATVATLMENDIALKTDPERVRAILIAASKVDRTPRPDGSFNQDQEGWGSLNAQWSNLAADQGSSGNNNKKTFTGVNTFNPGCPYSKPASQAVPFSGQAGRFVRFVITWNAHTTPIGSGRFTDYTLTVKNPAGTTIGTSARVASNYEVVEFLVNSSGGAGTYTATITPLRWACYPASEPVGWAWVGFPSP